jgi:D-3-phosphoglycerate dehydrogenase
MPLVVVTDYTFETLDVESHILRPLGCDVVSRRRTASAAELCQLVAEAEYVITQFAPLTAEVIAAMRKARLIVRYGVGVDNVDLEAARERRIPVCNVPDYCIDEVADHTLAFVLSLTRQVIPNSLGVRGGQWKLAVPLSAMRSLQSLTVGVVGFGRIGRAVVRRLLAFGCRVLVHDPVVPASTIQEAGCIAAGLPLLLADSDLVTLHCPSTPKTRRLINRETIAQMKPGALLINVGRGDLVEPTALIEALRSGHLSGAGLDVFDPEPVRADSPLLQLDNVVVSSHIASTSVQAARKLRETVAHTVVRAIHGEALANIVNGVTMART